MANKRYDQFPAGAYDTAKIFLQADPTTGALEKINLPSADTLLPTQVGNSGKFLTTNGTTASWANLPAAIMAIGGTVTSGTAGSILFINPSATLAQNNSSFYFDNSNMRLGVGTNAPSATFHSKFVGSAGLPALAGYEAAIFQRNVTAAYGVNLTLIAGSSGPAAIFFGSSATQYLGKILYDLSINSLSLHTNGASRMSISNNGTVSVGATGGSLLFNVNDNGTGFRGASVNNNNSSAGATYDGNSDVGSFFFRVYGSAYATPGLRSNSAFGASKSVFVVCNASGGAGESITLSTSSQATPILTAIGSSQNVLIGTTTDQASSLLTLASTTKGFLLPRMSTTQKNAISTPAEGLLVYDSTLHKLCVYTGSTWETVTSV